MNKFYFLLVMLSCLALKAQNSFDVTTLDGTPLNDGDVITVTTTEYPDAKIGFHVNNISDQEIKMYMKVYNMTNADGTLMETCFGGTCVSSITQDQLIPSNGFVMSAGTNNGTNDFYFNSNPNSTTGNFPMEYVFEFYNADELGFPVGASHFVTYRYDPEGMGVEDLQQNDSGINLLNSQVHTIMKVEALVESSLSLFDMQGKLIMSSPLMEGVNELMLNELNKGVYLVRIENDLGTFSGKILKL